MRLFLVLCFSLLTMLAHATDRSVTDFMGRQVEVPKNPQRIAVLNEPLSTIPLMELGITPIASLGRNDDGSYQFGADFIDNVLGKGHKKPQGFGLNGQIDLEKLRALKPDLIIGSDFDIGKVDQLSAIAPVYLQKFTSGNLADFAIEKNLADLTGTTNVFDDLEKKYHQRISDFNEKTGKFYNGKTYLVVLITDQISVIDGSSAVQALNDLGMKPLAIDSTHANDKTPKLMMKISPEEFGKLNPDLLVLMGSWADARQNEQTISSSLEKIMPGRQDFMKPAKEKRLLFLDSSKVFTSTFASAEHTIDALETLDRD